MAENNIAATLGISGSADALPGSRGMTAASRGASERAEIRRGVRERAEIRQICPICGRVCRENAIDKFGEVVGCEKCVNFESADCETATD